MPRLVGWQVRENEFGYLKRQGEALLRSSGLGHVIVRSAQIDGSRVEEELPVKVTEAVIAEALGARLSSHCVGALLRRIVLCARSACSARAPLVDFVCVTSCRLAQFGKAVRPPLRAQ